MFNRNSDTNMKYLAICKQYSKMISIMLIYLFRTVFSEHNMDAKNKAKPIDMQTNITKLHMNSEPGLYFCRTLKKTSLRKTLPCWQVIKITLFMQRPHREIAFWNLKLCFILIFSHRVRTFIMWCISLLPNLNWL